MLITTLVSPDRLTEGQVTTVTDMLAQAGYSITEWKWLEKNRAADLFIPTNHLESVRSVLSVLDERVDHITQAAGTRDKSLFVSDMDSTMIAMECIDELADFTGCKADVRTITESAMRGDIDFAEALHARVALLKDLPLQQVEQCLRERLHFMPGAFDLVQTLRDKGVHTILVSGGFTIFADHVATYLGFARYYANRLEIADNRLTGRVLQPLLDGNAKKEILLKALQETTSASHHSIAVGDGANDIPMIKASGLGIAYHAKQKTQDFADAIIRYGDLTVILYALGYPSKDWFKN